MFSLLADSNIYQLNRFIPDEVSLHTFNPDRGLPNTSEQADALLVRTVTKINAESIGHLQNLRFVGTASAGFDHVDTEYLAARNIRFANAPGCNARSVAEYIAVSLLLWAEANGEKLKRKTVGIIGVGHVGSSVANILEAMGIDYKMYDPPREIRESGDSFQSASREEALACDILSFHTPLTFTGKFATHHWLSEDILAQKEYELVINAARGGVLDEAALVKAFQLGSVKDIILDVWENEPEFSQEVARHCFLKSPHIAGYSEQAKINATRQVCEALGNFLGMKNGAVDELSKCNSNVIELDKKSLPIDKNLSTILGYLHPLQEFDQKMEPVLPMDAGERRMAFSRLRTHTSLRNEFRHIALPESVLQRYPMLSNLGFKHKSG